ncbi:hypothetical protein TRVL_06669 [Trypanosoma vivax]|nr:hypothetical protein TRVL_06669 [Trypanosoma vivax]
MPRSICPFTALSCVVHFQLLWSSRVPLPLVLTKSPSPLISLPAWLLSAPRRPSRASLCRHSRRFALRHPQRLAHLFRVARAALMRNSVKLLCRLLVEPPCISREVAPFQFSRLSVSANAFPRLVTHLRRIPVRSSCVSRMRGSSPSPQSPGLLQVGLSRQHASVCLTTVPCSRNKRSACQWSSLRSVPVADPPQQRQFPPVNNLPRAQCSLRAVVAPRLPPSTCTRPCSEQTGRDFLVRMPRAPLPNHFRSTSAHKHLNTKYGQLLPAD